MIEIGTLEELGVKPGDVVAIYNEYHKGTEVKVTDNFEKWCGANDHWLRIISRATPAQKIWSDMTPEEKGALLLARYEGKAIQSNHTHEYNPDDWNDCIPEWCQEAAYRVKPEPKVEMVKTHGCWSPKGQKPKTQYVYEIEFNIVDGHPDWGSAKVSGK